MNSFTLVIPEPARAGNSFNRFLAMSMIGRTFHPQRVHALATMFTRLTEASFLQYERGRETLIDYFAHPGFRPETRIDASIYFEACITDVWRAMRFARALRSQKEVPQNVKDAFPRTLAFLSGSAESKVRRARDAIQHFESDILKGIITEEHDLMLFPTGPLEVINEDTFRTIDRLRLREFELVFSELADWLGEMSCCIEGMALLLSDGLLPRPRGRRKKPIQTLAG
jgi:hypothetical protein